MANKKANVVVSPQCKAAYAWLARPDEGQQYSDGKYKVTLVMPKGDQEIEDFIAKITEMSETAATEEFKKLPKNLRYPFKDGDDAEKEEFHGHWMVTVKTKFEPGFVDAQGGVLEEDQCPSSGDIIRASFQLKAYKASGNFGVSAQLRNVQLLKKNNNGQSAASDFGSHNAIQNDTDSDDDFDIAI